jgi:two-component SAPR family response regulator
MVKGLRDMNIPFVVCTAYWEISDCLEDIPVIKKPVTKEALAIALLKAMKGR